MTTDKEKALELAISQIEKHFGKGSIMKLGEATVSSSVESIPSGSLALDLALGVHGIPRGRVTEIFGPESSGKTTLGQHIIAEVQKRGGIKDAKHEMSLGKTFLVLAVMAVIVGLISKISGGQMVSWVTALLMVVAFIVAYMLIAVMMMVSMWVMGAKNAGYFEALTVIVYPYVPLMSLWFVGLLLVWLMSQIHWIVALIVMVVWVFFLLLAYIMAIGAKLRAIMELAGTDLLTAIVINMLVILPTIVIGFAVGMMSSMSRYLMYF